MFEAVDVDSLLKLLTVRTKKELDAHARNSEMLTMGLAETKSGRVIRDPVTTASSRSASWVGTGGAMASYPSKAADAG